MARHRLTEADRRKAQKTTAARIARDKAALLRALETHHGSIEKACAAVGIGRKTYFVWQASDPVVAEEIKSISLWVHHRMEQRLIDMALGKAKPDKTMAFCSLTVLNARRKDWGYGIERKEHTGAGGGVIEHRVDLTDKTDDEVRQIIRDEVRKRQGLRSA